MRKSKKITNFSQLLDYKYGKVGTRRRKKFELKSRAFMIAEVIKAARRNARMTQEQLARRTGTKKSYISRIENGKSDIQLSTLYKIVEEGLGKKVNLTIG